MANFLRDWFDQSYCIWTKKVDMLSRGNNNKVQQSYFERVPKKGFIKTITKINYSIIPIIKVTNIINIKSPIV